MNVRKALVLSWENALVVADHAKGVQFITLDFAMSVILEIFCSHRMGPVWNVKLNVNSVMNLDASSLGKELENIRILTFDVPKAVLLAILMSQLNVILVSKAMYLFKSIVFLVQLTALDVTKPESAYNALNSHIIRMECVSHALLAVLSVLMEVVAQFVSGA